ncbi:MAG: ATP-binding protein [Victivallales bacterium]|nr:ATP-binding protein [Victivallales bacterium]
MIVTAEPEDWAPIIQCGLENQQIDFKGPQDWDAIGRVGRAKFARHAIALANTQGGYVVVGVLEDENGNPTRYVGMTEAQAASFDPSKVGQTINRYADPAVSLDIVRPVLDGRRYVVLVVYPFRELPHVCGETCESELQRGAFYIRTPDARSRVAVRASELHSLIQRALRNQRQMLGRMLRGILYEDRQADQQDTAVFPSLLERARRNARARLPGDVFRTAPLFELSVMPKAIFKGDTLTDARRALAALPQSRLAEARRTGLTNEICAGNESLWGVQSTRQGGIVCCWEYFLGGLFYCALPLASRPQGISSPDLLLYCGLSTAMAGQFFCQLNHQESLLRIAIRLANVQQCRLDNLLHHQSTGELVCQIPDIDVRRERTAGDLEAGAFLNTATDLYTDLCERFNAVFDQADIREIRLQLQNLLGGARMKG